MSIQNLQGTLTLHRFAGMAGTVTDYCRNGQSQFSIQHLKTEQLLIMNKEHLVFGPECTTANKYAVYQQIVDDICDFAVNTRHPAESNDYEKVYWIDKA